MRALFVAATVLLTLLAIPLEAGRSVSVYVCRMAEHNQEFAKPGFCPNDGMELVHKNSLLRLAVLIHQNVEEIDYVGPWEVFRWSGATFRRGSLTRASLLGIRTQDRA